MSEFKKCSNGHYYKDDSCPYCLPQRKVEDSFIWGLKPDPETSIIPVCKQCGHPIRKSIPSPVGSVSNNQYDEEQIAPWNYGWDGKCEYCGHDYTICMGIQIDDDGNKTDKKTLVSADCMDFAVHQGSDGIVSDKYTVLSGVTIRTFVGDTARGEVFLSANELKCLIDALKDSPLLEQHDCKFDPKAF